MFNTVSLKPPHMNGGVYAIHGSDDGIVKIGSAVSFRHRLRNYLTYFPNGIQIVAYLEFTNMTQIMNALTQESFSRRDIGVMEGLHAKLDNGTITEAQMEKLFKIRSDMAKLQRVVRAPEIEVQAALDHHRYECKDIGGTVRPCEWFDIPKKQYALLIAVMVLIMRDYNGATIEGVPLETRVIIHSSKKISKTDMWNQLNAAMDVLGFPPFDPKWFRMRCYATKTTIAYKYNHQREFVFPSRRIPKAQLITNPFTNNTYKPALIEIEPPSTPKRKRTRRRNPERTDATKYHPERLF